MSDVGRILEPPHRQSQAKIAFGPFLEEDQLEAVFIAGLGLQVAGEVPPLHTIAGVSIVIFGERQLVIGTDIVIHDLGRTAGQWYGGHDNRGD